jgi:hypothetical protein
VTANSEILLYVRVAPIFYMLMQLSELLLEECGVKLQNKDGDRFWASQKDKSRLLNSI